MRLWHMNVKPAATESNVQCHVALLARADQSQVGRGREIERAGLGNNSVHNGGVRGRGLETGVVSPK